MLHYGTHGKSANSQAEASCLRVNFLLVVVLSAQSGALVTNSFTRKFLKELRYSCCWCWDWKSRVWYSLVKFEFTLWKYLGHRKPCQVSIFLFLFYFKASRLSDWCYPMSIVTCCNFTTHNNWHNRLFVSSEVFDGILQWSYLCSNISSDDFIFYFLCFGVASDYKKNFQWNGPVKDSVRDREYCGSMNEHHVIAINLIRSIQELRSNFHVAHCLSTWEQIPSYECEFYIKNNDRIKAASSVETCLLFYWLFYLLLGILDFSGPEARSERIARSTVTRAQMSLLHLTRGVLWSNSNHFRPQSLRFPTELLHKNWRRRKRRNRRYPAPGCWNKNQCSRCRLPSMNQTSLFKYNR